MDVSENDTPFHHPGDWLLHFSDLKPDCDKSGSTILCIKEWACVT